MHEFTLMGPEHTVEEAYQEWVIKAAEVIFQTGGDKLPETLISRQFGLLLRESSNFRNWSNNKWDKFFRKKHAFVLSVNENDRWMFWFDSPRDVMPTVGDHQRKDQSLSRRLATSLRMLFCFTRNHKRGGKCQFELVAQPAKYLAEVCQIASSFGTLNLGFDEGSSDELVLAPDESAIVAHRRLEIDELFVPTQITLLVSSAIRTALPRVHSGSSIVHVGSSSPPRDLSDIWPTSNLSYSSGGSPGGSLRDDFFESETPARIFPLPADNFFPDAVFENPVSVAALVEQLERIARRIV